MPIARAERLVRAVMENIDNWEERLREIEAHAPSDNGNKLRSLTLLRDMEQTKLSLARLLTDLQP